MSVCMEVNPRQEKCPDPGSGKDSLFLDALAFGPGTWVLHPYRNEELQ